MPGIPQLEDPRSYHSKAVEIHRTTPNSIMLNQYFNPTNAHSALLLSWARNLETNRRKITHFFASAGTCGHSNGAGKYLKEQNPNVKIIPVDAENSWYATKGNPKPYKIEGIGIDFDAPLLNKNIVDEFVTVTDEHAIGMLKTISSKAWIISWSK